MSDDHKLPTRRNVSGLLAGVAALWLWPGPAPAGGPKDQGIGGTGAAPLRDEKETDRGIGGTGVIGTIQRFGSIVVNGLRIAYPRNAQVYLDGQKGSTADLKIGQVVRVVASGSDGHLSTRRINVTSEVVGAIERVSPDALNVLGQTVLTHGIANAPGLQTGDVVAVSGLRRPDGIIVASLIEPRPQGTPSVTGPVSFAPDGRMMVADLPLTGADPALVGHRAMFTGQLIGGGIFQVTQAENEGLLLGASVRRLSIEAYVDRGAEGLRLGSGLQVSGGRDIAPGSPAARAVIGASVDRGGKLVVDTIRAEPSGRPGGGTFGPGGPGRGGGSGGGPGGGPGGSPGGHGGPGAPGGPGGHGAAPGPTLFGNGPVGGPAAPGGNTFFGGPGGFSTFGPGGNGSFGGPIGPGPGGFGGAIGPGPGGFGRPFGR